MMKLVQVILVAASLAGLLLVAYGAEPQRPAADPNPLKGNQEQFARIQSTYYAESSNK
ncbi:MULTISPECIES: hypothetical protein [Paenibacillus]|uniref:hypothetical protein n=1 Tax=Paenibacillus TaxID=44249 RepID=UPI0013E0C75D|nr:hypothetical protein [Paenibacillus whitsoniae]